ncbi:hypothetical protein BXZ70DRAFT_1011706 [Cristinia sonorae]|uniref:TPR-like protein n=1 Tax=Cristinia sonorae TaxID=1940300 RepID=A0A8K0UFT3_9AGAR|nr:hypothetical protein BXZ70DRAFT_1011706 [Cristinia sonorae]
MAEPQALAAQLKAEGNALFLKKDYKLAHARYTQAIKEDGNNAILYANRAACCLGLQKFLDAATDAKKATEIDATYAKGWARLAVAQGNLGSIQRSIDAWKKAIAALSDNAGSIAEQKQLKEYQAELKAAEERLQHAECRVIPTIPISSARGHTPWQRGLAMEKEIVAKYNQDPSGRYRSSAMVIVQAYVEWKSGLDKMNSLKRIGGRSHSGQMMMGSTGGIEGFSNAILRDDRVFHLSQNDWVARYNDQVTLEALQTGAWTEGGPELIKTEAIKRQRTQGWNSVRRAITTTIRSYIMRGFMEATVKNNHSAGVEFIGRALEILRWGCETWKDVAQDDKGAIFQESFVRGVHALYIEIYMKACIDSNDTDHFSLETLLNEAEELLDHCDKHVMSPMTALDHGFALSFGSYPKGKGYSMIGFYHARTAAKLFTQPQYDAEAILQHYKDAAEAYLTAARYHPEDDELYIWFLACAIQNFFLAGTPIRTILPLMAKLRLAMPDVLKIWEFSSLMQGGRAAFTSTLEVEEDILAGLKTGQFTLDSEVVPEPMKRLVPVRK